MRRRQFLATLGAGAVGSAAYAHWIEPFWLEVTRRELPIEALPQSLDGKTLLHLSDLHIGPLVRDSYLHGVWDTAGALQADVVMYTGDFVTWQSVDQLDQLAGHLKRMPRGRMTTLAVLGNHDYGLRWQELWVAELVAEQVRAAGIRVLRNESLDLDGLFVAGIDDYWSPRSRPEEALVSWKRGAPSLVLNHNPDGMDERERWLGYDGWILSGHTHGGQCRPPFLPPPLLPVRNTAYTAGAIEVGDGRTVYISRGVGYTMQVRFSVRPEITLFTLRRA